MSLTIQISSIEVLERLLGNNEGVELEIKQAIAENFAKKHIKSLINEAVEKTISIGYNELLLQEVKANYGTKSYVLTGEASSLIAKNIHNSIESLIQNKILEVYSNNKYVERIENLISDAANNIIKTITDSNINKRIDDLVTKRIKEKLGIK